MPRQARIDAPGAVHHVIVRGIERRKIFLDDQDRSNWIARLEKILTENGTPCFAWASILCQEAPYLRELVGYIHLNPLRAGLVSAAV
jgi:REP element-mobilizing transposase RayT